MNDFLSYAFALIAGALLGVVFFGGLWLTIRKGLSSKRPAFWFFGSLLLRMSATLAGFYFVSGGRWQPLLPCLIGFVLARFIVTRLARSPGENHPRSAQEAGYAS